MTIRDIRRFGCVVFDEHEVPCHAESGTFPDGHKAIDAVLTVETDHQRVSFEYAVRLIADRLQPVIVDITNSGAPGTITKTDEVRRASQCEINSVIRGAGHNIDAVTGDKMGHTKLLLLQRAPGEHSCDARSPLPVDYSPRPVTGQADHGVPQPLSF